MPTVPPSAEAAAAAAGRRRAEARGGGGARGRGDRARGRAARVRRERRATARIGGAPRKRVLWFDRPGAKRPGRTPKSSAAVNVDLPGAGAPRDARGGG